MGQQRGSGGCRGHDQVPPPSGSASPPPPAGGGTGAKPGSSSSAGSGGTAGTGGQGGTGGAGGPGGMTDVLQYMIPRAPTLNSAAQHLASKQAGVNPIYVLRVPLSSTTGWIYYLKSAVGYPWDVNFYDSNYVYQVVTEGPSGWTDPTSYKIFVSPSWPNGRGGIGWSPRYIGPAPFENFLITEDSSYETWLGGALQNTQSLGTVSTLVQGPFSLAVGALGTIPTIIVSYQWNSPGVQLGVQEQHWYGFQLGLVRWQEYTLANGVYVLQTDNVFDQKVSGGTPTPVFRGTLP